MSNRTQHVVGISILVSTFAFVLYMSKRRRAYMRKLVEDTNKEIQNMQRAALIVEEGIAEGKYKNTGVLGALEDFEFHKIILSNE